MIDKNEVMVNYILTCPEFTEYKLYFNYAEETDNSNHFVTISDNIREKYIDGSQLKEYTFSIISYKSVSPSALVLDNGTLTIKPNENIEEMAEVQKIINWVNEQNEIKNFPNFGPGTMVEEMSCTNDDPNLAGITTDNTGTPLAKYSIIIRITYLDTTKRLWQ